MEFYLVNPWIANICWVLGSILFVELVRDTYHVVSHIWSPLYKWHGWHHRVFRPDLTPVSTEVYQKATWYHDVPESLVMLTFSLLLWALTFVWIPSYHWATLAGSVYTLSFLLPAIARGIGIPHADQLTDLNHLPGAFSEPPTYWFVNRSYHWRHHFDNQNAYFCGTLSLVDKLMGTALSLKGKTIAVTGASGSLGRSLLQHLHKAGAKVIALTSGNQTITLNIDGKDLEIDTINWQISQENNLVDLFEKVDILVLNHGINVHGEKTAEAIAKSYEINTFSSWRMLEIFIKTVRTNSDIACKEVWVNTSEAEVSPAFSPLYELTKRTLGDLVTLRKLDAPCVIRKLILGPFKSNLNPIGIMSADWVAKQIVKFAKADVRTIIVTINPLTFVAIPIKEFLVYTYFKLFTSK
ncbi:MAG: bifunctional sterol desaturase/short chain dehydrogenase [Okeania sp. SIO2G4]|uniref:bifunctional sterol desaturase/short chain dehydrogenase n=1 Tax=unclassified Okeania TaxID=2634635 RepID=UPI0013B90E58|nr:MULTISPECIES: bifunctional sterol desaturase/short chain dehydrogenase [unclassified Okeania]NEP07506.1 bifunctional sterol desaturase/short chain dehydrogenase [Okeania sp. SIO4D6]NEP44535.1 bifunctional sterol desaturase/short chain dehydrogenase [Okeania sp. SIO2H7]NEP72132.1 bifunctional sterol desaturase/short chain dehydrogenase [Okeania sp. SIO2G5]NEP92990.1 bifunctional sterol desaturase/short chain dehydrogenase [Okeania sp. SIO2F5]NEQ91110.1 bifunctional sterol desaturase/short ch